uniref:Uncharacterized protein n=1 Tax=Timema shepardi TaxID=629360 RepID=A0A7R9B3Q1_TIMSH|nr:unnamed protein product [Timema shepardi]
MTRPRPAALIISYLYPLPHDSLQRKRKERGKEDREACRCRILLYPEPSFPSSSNHFYLPPTPIHPFLNHPLQPTHQRLSILILWNEMNCDFADILRQETSYEHSEEDNSPPKRQPTTPLTIFTNSTTHIDLHSPRLSQDGAQHVSEITKFNTMKYLTYMVSKYDKNINSPRSHLAPIQTYSHSHQTCLTDSNELHCPTDGEKMNRWKGRVALVTGASAGIGEAIAKALVKQGMKVVGLARSLDRMKNYEKELEGEPGKFYPIKADMTKEEDLLAAFKWVDENLDGVDVLVNNAGVAFEARLLDGKTDQWRQILETNILGLNICTREAYQSMKSRGVDDGHIIHINSNFTVQVHLLEEQGSSELQWHLTTFRMSAGATSMSLGNITGFRPFIVSSPAQP